MIPHDIADYEGPRTPRKDEWESVIGLTRSIFFDDSVTYREAMSRWPMALSPDARRHVLTMFREGRPISSMGRLVRDVRIGGHSLRVGYVGAVCTHPDHRGKGLASTLLDATLRRCHRDGVDVVYISGTRPLYYGAGADHVGVATRFALPDDLLRFRHRVSGDLRPANPEEAGILAAIQAREGVRFVRPLADFRLVLEHGHCAGEPCAFYLIRHDDVPVAYLLARPVTQRGGPRVVEYAGDRLAIRSFLDVLSATLKTEKPTEVDIPRGDPLIPLMEAIEAVGTPVRSDGTVKVLDPCRTLLKLRPYFRERVADWSDAEWHCAEGKQRYTLWSDDGFLQVDGERNMLWTLLGKPPDATLEPAQASGIFAEILERWLPIPFPSFVLNMI